MAWIIEDHHAILGVICIVGTCVVFHGVEYSAADRSYGAPCQVCKIDNQVRCYAAYAVVSLLRYQNPVTQWLTIRTWNGTQSLGQRCTFPFILGQRYGAFGFTTTHVHEYTGVITPCTPCFCVLPIYGSLF